MSMTAKEFKNLPVGTILGTKANECQYKKISETKFQSYPLCGDPKLDSTYDIDTDYLRALYVVS